MTMITDDQTSYIHRKMREGEHYTITGEDVLAAVDHVGMELRRQDYIPDKMAFIRRGGSVPSTQLSNYFYEQLKKRIWSWAISIHREKGKAYMPYWWPSLKRDKKYLIIDDIYDTGRTYEIVKKECPSMHNIKFVFLFVRNYNKLPKEITDNCIFGFKLPENDKRWLDFPWEIKNDQS